MQRKKRKRAVHSAQRVLFHPQQVKTSAEFIIASSVFMVLNVKLPDFGWSFTKTRGKNPVRLKIPPVSRREVSHAGLQLKQGRTITQEDLNIDQQINQWGYWKSVWIKKKKFTANLPLCRKHGALQWPLVCVVFKKFSLYKRWHLHLKKIFQSFIQKLLFDTNREAIRFTFSRKRKTCSTVREGEGRPLHLNCVCSD